ncbi:MAG: bifunctional SulP family inorganic anion transporter/carbonic anhydrase [Deltaproteobacteria bacterium]|nr:bifunctional SulP family inorganic anion transporter/carbonic anhydrase [Deltaproteobacteria bacterium]
MPDTVLGGSSSIRYDLGLRELVASWRALFTRRHLVDDAVAGLTVACVAVPLSLAIALASGVQPAVGLVTGIVAGIVCGLFGGTPLSVSGPAAAMAVLIAAVVQEHGLGGLLVVGLGSGLLQVLTGVLSLGRLIRYVPVPVIEGFTAGIGAIILVGQLPRAFGLPPPDQSHIFGVLTHVGALLHATHPVALGLSMLSLALCLFTPKLLPKVPGPLVAVLVPTALVVLLRLDAPSLGAIPRSLPMPHLPTFPSEGLGRLSNSVLIVYALASLETLLSSTAVDKIAKGERHDPDQELIGQGLGNVAVALFGGIPVTGVIARSALNVQAGAKTRRASIIHSLVLVAVVFVFAPLLSKIPMAALAGVLLSVALRMLDPRHFKLLWRVSRSEATIYAVTFAVIVVGDLIAGVQAGLLLAFLVAAVRLGRVETELHMSAHGPARLALRGAVTFLSQATFGKAREALLKQDTLRGVVIDASEVSAMDVTGAELVTQLVTSLEARGTAVAILEPSALVRKRLVNADQSGRMAERMASSELELHALLDPEKRTTAIDRLRSGAERFRRMDFDRYQPLFGRLAEAQDPHTLFITCSDSRIVPNLVTSTDPGELFLVRNVGNIIPAHGPDETPAEGAALEFALAALKVTEVVVCGHSGCGAMSAMLKDGARELPSVHKWLESAEGLKARLGPDATAADVARANVVLQLEHLETYPMVKERLASGAVRLHGWYYDIGTGEIEAWDAASSAWLRIDSDEVHRRTSQTGAEPSGPEEVPMRVPSAEA